MITSFTTLCLVLLFAFPSSSELVHDADHVLLMESTNETLGTSLRRRMDKNPQPEYTSYSKLTSQSGCLDSISQGTFLVAGDLLCSKNGRYKFGLSVKGDLGIWRGSTHTWSAGITNAVIAKVQNDGNFVVRDGKGKVYWRSRTQGGRSTDTQVSLSNDGIVTVTNKQLWKRLKIDPFAVQVEVLETLPPIHPLPPINPISCVAQVNGRIDLHLGHFICSPNKRFRFGVDLTGNLGLFEGDQVIWSASTCCTVDNMSAVLQHDGNLVLRNPAGQAFWSARVAYMGAAAGVSSLSLTNSGMVSVVNPEGQRVWAVAPNPSKKLCKPQDTPDGRLVLREGQFICSPNAQFRFGIFEGDLSLWEYNRMRWSGGTCCSNDEDQANILMKFRFSANLVVVNADTKELLYSTGTGVNFWSSFLLNNDGMPRIISAAGKQLWTVDELQFDTTDESNRRAMTTSPSASPSERTILLAPRPRHPQCVPSGIGPMQLKPGDFICSPNGQYQFGLSFGGELVLLDYDLKVWSAETTGNKVSIQRDGNLVLYSPDLTPRWSSQTADKEIEDVELIMGDDGVAGVRCSHRGIVWSTAIALNGRVLPVTLYQKAMTGYQGWFYAPGDGGLDHWNHWSEPRTLPDKNSVLVDMWPDLSEFDDDELFPTGFKFANGSTAPLYSAYTTRTVERHTQWMQEYGIDGVFLQRFIGDVVSFPHVLDKVLDNIRSGSEKFGRTFAVMYDIGNGDDATLVDDLINDWKRLVDDTFISKSSQYLHHKNRPLLAIWGLGIHDREADYGHATEILNWFQYEAEDKYKVTLMGGVPTGWRDLTRDSKTDPEWVKLYRRFDVISPWAVGRMIDEKTADHFLETFLLPDMAECEASGIDYLPVVFPGFSSHHLLGKPFNEIPRLGGDFLWRQFHNAINAGNSMVYIAMFDEVDEGTAIFKISPEAPAGTPFVSLDEGLPNDWYLQLAREAASYLHEGLEVPATIPIRP